MNWYIVYEMRRFHFCFIQTSILVSFDTVFKRFSFQHRVKRTPSRNDFVPFLNHTRIVCERDRPKSRYSFHSWGSNFIKGLLKPFLTHYQLSSICSQYNHYIYTICSLYIHHYSSWHTVLQSRVKSTHFGFIPYCFQATFIPASCEQDA